MPRLGNQDGGLKNKKASIDAFSILLGLQTSITKVLIPARAIQPVSGYGH